MTLTNNESSGNAYVKVEYKIDSGPYQTHGSGGNVTVTAGSPNTSITQSVPEGSTITWRITDSFTSNDWTNMVTETPVTSSAANCNIGTNASQDLPASCSSGAGTSTLSKQIMKVVLFIITFSTKLMRSWTDKNTNKDVAGGATNTSLTQSVPHGSKITWQFKDSLTSNNFSEATYEGVSESSAVDCDPNVTPTTALNSSCSSGSDTATLTLTNNESSGNAYVKVEYKIDSGAYQTHGSGSNVNSRITKYVNYTICSTWLDHYMENY